MSQTLFSMTALSAFSGPLFVLLSWFHNTVKYEDIC